jgi:hypothetical protein
MCSSSREEIVEVFDALKADFERHRIRRACEDTRPRLFARLQEADKLETADLEASADVAQPHASSAPLLVCALSNNHRYSARARRRTSW